MSIENIELEKFINEASEHLRRTAAEIPESHIKKLCDLLGDEKVKITTGNYKHPRPLKEIIDVSYLSKELKNITSGNRADVIYEFEEFSRMFFSVIDKKGTEENDEEIAWHKTSWCV